MAEVSQELIYAGKDVEQLILKAFPEAKITDASDYIHTERFECEIDIPEDEFYIFAIRNGFATLLLSFQIMMHCSEPEMTQRVWDLVAEAKALEESEG